MAYQLLETFRDLFHGQAYRHRKSNLGDTVARQLYEDLHRLERSEKYVRRVENRRSVVNIQNRRHGVRARRGDGSFGEIIPNEIPIAEEGFLVARGPIATIEIGIEVKIMMKAMIKQIDRVINDLRGQVEQFRSGGGNPICVGIVGVNHAPYCTTYEGDRQYRTNGSSTFKHPIEEADEAERRLIQFVGAEFDEFIILRFGATNESPFEFDWTNRRSTRLDYGAALARISREYDIRF